MVPPAGTSNPSAGSEVRSTNESSTASVVASSGPSLTASIMAPGSFQVTRVSATPAADRGGLLVHPPVRREVGGGPGADARTDHQRDRAAGDVEPLGGVGPAADRPGPGSRRGLAAPDRAVPVREHGGDGPGSGHLLGRPRRRRRPRFVDGLHVGPGDRMTATATTSTSTTAAAAPASTTRPDRPFGEAAAFAGRRSRLGHRVERHEADRRGAPGENRVVGAAAVVVDLRGPVLQGGPGRSSGRIETRIRSTLQDWAAEIDDDPADADTGFSPGGSAPIRLVALDPAAEPGPSSREAAASTKRSPIRALVLAGAAAAVVLVLVVAVAVVRSPGTDVQAVDGPMPSAPEGTLEETPGPRAIATVLPDGYGPIWRSETTPGDPAAVIGGGAHTVQRFDVASGSVTLVVRPGIGTETPTDFSPNGKVHQQPATVGSGRALTRVTWNELGAMIDAVSVGPDETTTLAVLDSLVLRTADPADGFDVPAGGTTGATLRAEQVWPRGSISPTTSTVAYAAGGSSQWSVVVSSSAAAGGADLDLVTSEVGSEQQVIAGKERVVVTPERQFDQVFSSPYPGPELADFFHVVAWYDADGALIVVRTKDVDEATIAAIAAGIDRADDTTWATISTEISVQVGRLPVASTSTWGNVELTMRGDAMPGGTAVGGALGRLPRARRRHDVVRCRSPPWRCRPDDAVGDRVGRDADRARAREPPRGRLDPWRVVAVRSHGGHLRRRARRGERRRGHRSSGLDDQ